MSVTVKELLEAGAHFGHQAHRWNPKMQRYILGKRGGIHLIDLRKTAAGFEKALDAVRQVSGRGGRVLFVGTKKQAQEIMAEEARRCGQYYVNRRWLGGQLTNFKTIKVRTAKLRELDTASQDGTYGRYSKKEALTMERLRTKLEIALGGIKEMPQTPDMMFVIDPRREKIAIAEANMLGIPVVAIVDTNCDPEAVDYPVPANDDSSRAIRLLVGRFADAIIESRKSAPAPAPAPAAEGDADADAAKPAARKPAAKKPAAKKPAPKPAAKAAAPKAEAAEAAEAEEAPATEAVETPVEAAAETQEG
ncbi:MAG: 30S ribosomal protein S2 [Nitrospirota bacterium]|nr:30S ribosomal protein S2 [Nitrospirota bacterium]